MIDRIARIEYATRDTVKGERITMESGAIWFHPYNGKAPIKEN